ncbi:MAG: methylenetetrahydrofolate reductase C-terminal domain-containing protein [Bacillota bacterium]|uniref:Methylene-tetrahydrofolate reductase C terminal n=2 Tax=Carboxydocella TaxID=178898 RepID=A0A1T4M469_9FIRM|nr:MULTISPECIES: methylenetetrahydrofolate reductase C-terminal domain-containing protein [Carboxydocella]AVX21048.1 Methylene-tetrahydrofolate reductase C terminal domain [Carboxydocella thermautotrophica]AVX31468.1 Methylene-tetrahydrofolate reductase C terminal domain [Carboxydocella thermautotrophica]SJZ61790.1 Methylene-tetrahydrofolate reductase C terminal [Carboxydocella sporoproducens DSM 16521]GAW28804.1 hypothetical protein ULO1_13740 [Carboxydocella sp. ULO1]GAW32628.1 hypothetical 
MPQPAKSCQLCQTCLKQQTFDICPVRACAKGLNSGPCGGTRPGGQCEVGSRRCGWALIFQKAKTAAVALPANAGINLKFYG